MIELDIGINSSQINIGWVQSDNI